MFTTISYLFLAVTLIGAVLGLTGNAWDANKTGRVKFTGRGWISLAILLIGFALSAITIYQTNLNNEAEKQRNDYERQQRLLVKHLAYKEIDSSIFRMTYPFLDMYIANGGELPIKGNKIFETFTSDSALRLFTSSSFLDKPTDDITGLEKYDISYSTAINKVFNTEPNRLLEIVKTYSYYLDSEDIVSINSIADDSYVQAMQNLPSGNAAIYPYNWIDEEDHKNFFAKLNRLLLKVKLDDNSSFSRDIEKKLPEAMPTKVEPNDKTTSNKSLDVRRNSLPHKNVVR